MISLIPFLGKEDDMLMSDEKILIIKDLTVNYPVDGNIIRAVDKVSLFLNSGEVLGLVGESGCGKSTLGFAILRLLKGGKIEEGNIFFKGNNLLKMSEKEMQKIRGSEMSMIFQASQNALNPLQKVSDHFIDTLKFHKKWNETTWTEIMQLIDQLEIPKSRLNDHPFQFSGGMQQRIVIALTLILKPELIIADEPTTALDVLVQARTLEILKELIKDLNLTVIYITHDLSVVSNIAHRVAIMYAGQIVEISDTSIIFKKPAHPYTKALISAIPDVKDKEKKNLAFIPGHPPDMRNLPEGCRFAERCPYAISICEKTVLKDVHLTSTSKSGHLIKCLMYQEEYSHLFNNFSDKYEP
ncbi:ABC transporter ATP-binding protein [Candidatus Hodarchaeum mangrovi]